MEVTRLNFNDIYDKVCKSIDEADFLSFDTELTGLGRKGENRHIALDTPEERYIKLRNDISRYNIIQFGLSAFKIDLSNKTVQTATYCFYLSGKEDESYTYDSSSLEFLANNGFNFNKLFLSGVPFLSLEDEKVMREEKGLYASLPKNFEVKTKESQLFMNKMTEKLAKKSVDRKVIIPSKELSSFNRKLLTNNIALKFPSYLFKYFNNAYEITQFDTLKEKKEYTDNIWEENLRKKIGFGLIGRKIFEAKKPLIGHNPVLDVFHLVDKIVAKLPETYEQFKLLTKENLPIVYDTKLIVKDPPFATKIINSALVNVYEELCCNLKDIVLTTEPGTQSYSIQESTGLVHNAGFDAFMTGICFLATAKKLQGSQWMKQSPFQSPSLNLYANKLNLMFTHDIPYLDLNKDEIVPDRSKIFVVNCPHTCTETDIKTYFSDLKTYRTYWVNSTKVYVVPQDPQSLSLAKVTSKCREEVFVSMYSLPSTVSSTNAKISYTTKHTLEDRCVSEQCDKQLSKRIKNSESSRMSKMTINSNREEMTAPLKDYFAMPNEWK